ncbi:DUF1566 domain-containing protein [Flavobacterium okayamense]|nr:DUF1566 domain-containing protein [Flavobacterium okayamense]
MFKIKSWLALATILSIASCSSDDTSPQTPSVTLQDLEVTIDENPTNGAVIGTVQSNSTTALTFNIVSQTPSGAMEIDASTGELTIIDAALFDFETNPAITATVSASGASNNATVTIELVDKAEIGEYKYGGVIFWINANGNEGYVVSINDQSSGAVWGCIGLDIPGAEGQNIGDGESNTLAIVSSCNVSGIAADMANDIINGFSDWFLPNLNEFGEIYNNKAIINSAIITNGGSIITDDNYWTSIQSFSNSSSAYAIKFWDGTLNNINRDNLFKVRAVRHWTDF